RGNPFIFDAHPPARLRIGIVDEHQARLMHEAFALLHHHLAILVEKGVHEWLQERRERRHPDRGGPEYLMHLGRLVGHWRNRCKAHDGVVVSMSLLYAQPRTLVGNLSFEASPE